MIEIVNNDENIDINSVNLVVKTYYLLFINDNNELVLDNHHNTYYLIHKYDKTSISESFDISIDDYSPFLVRKKYVCDYPLIGENTLYENYYYKINKNIGDENYQKIYLNNIKSIIENNRYLNPHNQEVALDILEVLKYLDK